MNCYVYDLGNGEWVEVDHFCEAVDFRKWENGEPKTYLHLTFNDLSKINELRERE